MLALALAPFAAKHSGESLQPARALAPAPSSTAAALSIARAAVAVPTSTAVPIAPQVPTEAPLPAELPPLPTGGPLATDPPIAPEATAPITPPSPATPVRGGTTLPLPDGVTVVWGGCSSDGECHDFNFYWAPTHQVVMQYGEGENKIEHEYCHAHQHWTINAGAPLSPSNYDLHAWYSTGEGESFSAAVSGLAWPWSHSAVNDLEDFAWTCAAWYLDPAYLLRVSPERYAWAAANLP
jgi:hypothetical protein